MKLEDKLILKEIVLRMREDPIYNIYYDTITPLMGRLNLVLFRILPLYILSILGGLYFGVGLLTPLSLAIMTIMMIVLGLLYVALPLLNEDVPETVACAETLIKKLEPVDLHIVVAMDIKMRRNGE